MQGDNDPDKGKNYYRVAKRKGLLLKTKSMKGDQENERTL